MSQKHKLTNWNTGVDRNRKNFGIGIIVRDSMGEVLATLSKPKDYIIEPDIVEAKLALRTVQFCCELSFYRVALEGDTL
jgi:hypothetical protein